MPTIRELVDSVDQRLEFGQPEAKARELMRSIPREQYEAAAFALAKLVFAERWIRSTRKTPAVRAVSPGPATDKPPTPALARKTASPKVALASRAWNDLLTTEIALSESQTKVAIRDLNADQLTTLADQLYDTHERLHLLAEHVRLNGVTCARELTPAALAAVIGEAAA